MSYIGRTPTPAALTASDIADGIISEAKMADDAISLTELKAGTDGNVISYDASGDPVAIATGTAGHFLKSQGAGAQPVFAAGGTNTPAFDVQKPGSQAVSSATYTKVAFYSEIYDTDGCFDADTNNRFTPTTAGKYYVYAQVQCNSAADDNLSSTEILIYKNGSADSHTTAHDNFATAYPRIFNAKTSATIDFNGSSDYVEVFVNINDLVGDPTVPGTNNKFGAFRIIE